MCYCGTNHPFENCCAPLLNKKFSASSSEALMRSRYSAYVLKNIDYLRETHDTQTRSHFDFKSTMEWAQLVNFTQLQVIRSEESGNKGLVEFKAYFEEINTKQKYIHHEISKFRKQQGIWYFREGKVITKEKG